MVKESLIVRNPNKQPVAFKLKTTAPRQYCVRPNSGRIEAGQEVEIQVLLQAMKEEPPENFKCKDKFLVQSIPISADKEGQSVQDIWSHSEKLSKDQIFEKKVRCVFFSPSETGGTHLDPNHAGETNANETNDSYENASNEKELPQQQVTSPPVGAVTSMSSKPEKSDENSNISTLEQAQAQIKLLTARLEESTLRQRKSEASAADSSRRITTGAAGTGGSALRSTKPEGIPVQIVAALCLGAFFLAYFL